MSTTALLCTRTNKVLVNSVRILFQVEDESRSKTLQTARFYFFFLSKLNGCNNFKTIFIRPDQSIFHSQIHMDMELILIRIVKEYFQSFITINHIGYLSDDKLSLVIELQVDNFNKNVRKYQLSTLSRGETSSKSHQRTPYTHSVPN